MWGICKNTNLRSEWGSPWSETCVNMNEASFWSKSKVECVWAELGNSMWAACWGWGHLNEGHRADLSTQSSNDKIIIETDRKHGETNIIAAKLQRKRRHTCVREICVTLAEPACAWYYARPKLKKPLRENKRQDWWGEWMAQMSPYMAQSLPTCEV